MDSKKNVGAESVRGYRRASWRVVGFAALAGVAGCWDDSARRAPDEAIAIQSGELATPAGVRLFTETNNVVNVCFHRGANDIRIKMRAAIERTWGAVARIHFSGWRTCPADPDDIPETWIPIDVFENTASGSADASGGNCQSGVGARQGSDDPRIRENTQLFINTGANRAYLETDTIHEMGHCLGATHEHQRSDTPLACSRLVQTTPPLLEGACVFPSHCNPGRDCINNRCTPRVCTTSSECFGNSACITGRCSTTCSTDAQCPDTHFCDLSTGRCADGNNVLSMDSQNLTPWDPDSIMNAIECRSPSAPLEPSFWDIYGMQKLYGRRGPLQQIITSRNVTGDYLTRSGAPGGYTAKYAEGWVWQRSMPGTVPLDIYWHSGRGDNWAVATSGSRTAAENAGYVFRSRVGYIYAAPQPGTNALRRYRSPNRLENITTASAAAEQEVLAAGYTFIGDEGYIFRASGVPFDTLTYYWSTARNDSLLTRTGSQLAQDAENEGYFNRGLDGITLKHNVEQTTALRQFWNTGRSDHFAAATPQGINAAFTGGYSELPREGYVFTTSQNDTQGLRLYWNPLTVDNFTTAENQSDAILGYQFVRNEGFVPPALW